eukprot:420249_1
MAAWNGNSAILRLLDMPKIDLNAAHFKGFIPLNGAAYCGKYEIVQILLATGKVCPNTVDKVGNSALMNASEKGFTNIVQLLVDYRPTNFFIGNEDGKSA